MIEDRSYQQRAIEALQQILPSRRRVLAVSPTGSGKTLNVALLLKREPRWQRVLFVAHRYELIDQTFRTLQEVGIDAGVIMASDEQLHGRARVRPDARVQVASVQTIARRGVPSADLIVIDEAHRTMADTYQRIVSERPDCEVLGITATPYRLDGRGLGDFYTELYVIAEPSELHQEGYLAKPRVYSAPPAAVSKISAGLKNADVANKDYTVASTTRAVDTSFLVGQVVAEAKRLAPKVPKIVFACSVQHSKHLTRKFARAGIKAVHIDADTDAADREETLTALRRGRIEVICNVDILSEGWDMPALGAVIIARPTRSLSRFLQMAGRCTRPYRGRTPLIIDHGANVQRLDTLPGADIKWSLLGSQPRSRDAEPALKVCPGCYACIAAACTECPLCGADTPIERTPRELREETRQRLVEYNEQLMEQLRAVAVKIATRHGAPEKAEEIVRMLEPKVRVTKLSELKLRSSWSL